MLNSKKEGKSTASKNARTLMSVAAPCWKTCYGKHTSALTAGCMAKGDFLLPLNKTASRPEREEKLLVVVAVEYSFVSLISFCKSLCI